MNFDTMQAKIKAGDYDSKLPYPAYRPRLEEAEFSRRVRDKHIEADRAMKRAYNEDNHMLRRRFEVDMRHYFEDVIGHPITDEQFHAIYSQAWEDGHAYGYHEILNEVSALLDIAQAFDAPLFESRNLLAEIWQMLDFHCLTDDKVFLVFQERVEKVLGKEKK